MCGGKLELGQIDKKTLVGDVVSDLDEVFLDVVKREGLSIAPQIVGAIVPECRAGYLHLLLESSPEIGTGVIFGTLVLRGAQYFVDALDVAQEACALASDQSMPNIQLLRHAVLLAFQARQSSELTNPIAIERMGEFRQVEANHWRSEGDTTNIESQFPEFRRYRAIIDELNRVLISGEPVRSQLFAEQASIMESYFKAVFGSLTHKGSELQQAALKSLETLDPLLHQHFKHGLEHHYLSRSGPTRL